MDKLWDLAEWILVAPIVAMFGLVGLLLTVISFPIWVFALRLAYRKDARMRLPVQVPDCECAVCMAGRRAIRSMASISRTRDREKPGFRGAR